MTGPVRPPAGPALLADAADCGAIASGNDAAVIALVRARGNARLTKADVCKSISIRAGDRFDGPRIASDIHMLWNTGAFDDVAVERKDSASGGILTFVVRERPLLGHLAIDGAAAFPLNVLYPLTRLREGQPLDMGDVERGRGTLLDAYQERGYRSAKVDFHVDPASPTAVTVSYRVEEGPLAAISTFAFTGVSASTDRELRTLIETRGGTVNVHGGLYDDSGAERTVLLVQARLYDRGLVQSTVEAPVLSLSPDGKSLAVTIAIHEGPVFRIGKIIFTGALAADQATYLRLLGQRTGAVFSRSAMMQGFERIRAMQDKLGKPIKEIAPDTDIDAEKKTVALTIGLEPS